MQKQITVRVDIELYKELDMYVLGRKMQGEKISKNSFVVELIRKALKEKEEKVENEK